jgi:chromosome partitioning protein
MTEIVAIISHKGGTGKTSLVQNLAHELAQTRRVLAVDLDPQSNLTIGSGFDLLEDRPTILQAMHAPQTTADTILQTASYSLLPASLDLALADQQFAGHYDQLRDALAQVEDRFDLILIDGPPNLGFFAFNALTAATQAIVPLQCQPYAFRALDGTLQLIDLVRKGNRRLHLQAVVLTMYDRRVTLTGSVEAAARERFGDLVPQTVIPVNVSVAEATLDGVPVAVYDPRSAGAAAYRALAKELFHGN